MTMTANPELVTRPAQWSIAIPVKASLSEWNKTIEAIPQLLAWIEEQNIQLASPLFYRYRRIGGMERPFSVEVGFAIEEPVEVTGDVVLSEMEGGAYLVCTHHGIRMGSSIPTPSLNNGRQTTESALTSSSTTALKS